MRIKNTLLHDFREIFKNIKCESLTILCSECKNKKLCDTVEDIVRSIYKFY